MRLSSIQKDVPVVVAPFGSSGVALVNGRTLLSRLKGIGALVIECDTRPNRFDLQVGVGASEEDVVELLRSGDPSLSSGS